MLFAWGINDQQKIVELIEQYGNDFIVATIKQCALVVEKKGKIQNPSGYIIEAIRKGYHKEAIEETKQEQKQVNKKLKAQEKATKDAETKEAAKLQFFAERKQLIEEVLENLPKEEVEQIKQDFIASKDPNPLAKKMIENKGLSHPMIEAWRHQSIAEQFLEDRYKGFEAYWENRII